MLPLGANPLQPLIDVCDAILDFWHDATGSWGVAIIGLTVVVRLAILPLTFRQVRSMQTMQRLAPEMKKIQERYKDDKQRQQQELMKFYSEHNFNPLSSCLPLLLQLPFFLSLFYLQQQDEFKDKVREGNGEQFLFIPDLTKPAEGWVLAVLILVYIATQLGSSLVTMVNIQDKNQRRIMLALPFVFTVVIINFQTGLLVYWITTNVWTIGQQLAVKKFLPPPDPEELAKKKKETDGKPAKRRQGMMERAAARASEGGNAGGGNTDSGESKAKPKAKAKASSGKSSGGGNGGPRKPPPPSPRKKKKRSGRRR